MPAFIAILAFLVLMSLISEMGRRSRREARIVLAQHQSAAPPEVSASLDEIKDRLAAIEKLLKDVG